MSYKPSMQPIAGDNLSYAWANAFIRCFETSGGVLSPAIVSFPTADSDGNIEIPEIRNIVESQLQDPSKYVKDQSVVETVAGTIFPETIWLLSGKKRDVFYDTYKRMLPFIRRKHANRRGVYFQRMVAYDPQTEGEQSINQLEHIITTWTTKGNHRHSALQAAILDPRVDHSNARLLGFPCLQQVAFHPHGANGKDGLSVVAFYATQTLEEKAYGNYLGLLRLGRFMAQEMGLEFKEVVCIASDLKLNNTCGKARCETMYRRLKEVVPSA